LGTSVPSARRQLRGSSAKKKIRLEKREGSGGGVVNGNWVTGKI